MFLRIAAVLTGGLVLLPELCGAVTQAPVPDGIPSYTQEGKLLAPEAYREWIYLSPGFDMSYVPVAQSGQMSIFDNVFVNPAAYREFRKTGTWPDKTVLILESRSAENKGSINQAGHYQGTELMGVEAHVKDKGRFPGGWAFFDIGKDGRGSLIPTKAACYSCHQQHAAVDTTFVQFYPTLLGIAAGKGTLSSPYLKEAGKLPESK